MARTRRDDRPDWLYRSGRRASVPFFERYLDGPVVTSPAELRTEVLHRG